ncbi:MAG TPA: hypothetical protein VE360_08210, partial [Pyrinomonadaceae bacterium]|nr:hypothetical protein [Pyrinomonadaceae bacterium]
MQQKLTAAIIVLALATLFAACGDAADKTTTNANMNTATTATVNSNTAAMPTGGSEIMTETAGGVTTETRTFKDPNSPVEKV